MVERIIYLSGRKMKRFPILSADVFYKQNIGTPEQRAQLLKEAWDTHRSNPESISFSNLGCWRSFFEYSDISWLMAEIKDSINVAAGYYIDADPIYKTKTNSFLDAEIKYWTNINNPGSKNNLHEHKLHHYVAVYYVQGRDTGEIIFHNPINLTEGCNPYAPFVSPISFKPNDGDLLVWPAWLPHETEPNKSTRHRINIAFNIRFSCPQHINYE